MKEKVGVIVATEREQKPFFKFFGMPSSTYQDGSRTVNCWEKYSKTIYLIRSGYGEIAATSATQYLIDIFNVNKIINYGAVGSLSEEHQVGKIGLVEKIVHYGFDLSASGKYPVGRYPSEKDLYFRPIEGALRSGISSLFNKFEICASADKFVGGGEDKRSLHNQFHADICDMESAGIVQTCNDKGIPSCFIKVISDGVDDGEKAFDKNVEEVSERVVEILCKILS